MPNFRRFMAYYKPYSCLFAANLECRLSTVRNADRIIVLHDDGIAEQGQHDELIARGGVYSRLYDAHGNYL